MISMPPLDSDFGCRTDTGLFLLSSGHCALFSPLVAFAAFVGFALPFQAAGVRTIRLACYREIWRLADRAGLSRCWWPILCQRCLQGGVKRQYCVSEVFAIAARPPFIKHVAGVIERQASVVMVVICALGNDELFYRFALIACQFAGFIHLRFHQAFHRRRSTEAVRSHHHRRFRSIRRRRVCNRCLPPFAVFSVLAYRP